MESRVALIIRLIVVNWGIVGVWEAPMNRVADSVFISRILAYSARKNSAKGPPAYSTLKPETSSDSPSVRSKGARFVSARVETNHIAARGQIGKISHTTSCATLKICKVKPPLKIMVFNRISPKLTSYEMVWATARRAPTRAYLEFEAQPEPRIEYTAKLERARINRMPRFKLVIGCGMGMGAHKVRANVRARMGARRNRIGEAAEG